MGHPADTPKASAAPDASAVGADALAAPDAPAVGAEALAAPDFVPPDFRVPDGLARDGLRLVPLGPEHNARDYRAWTSSLDHIRHTPGFERGDWPRPMSIEDNLRDLRRHADDFRKRTGFTYSVMIDDDVVGCVYIYPAGRPGHAAVRSWVSQDRARLDEPLYELVHDWLRRDWPFAGLTYAPRTRRHE
jgi:hypothetical protein